MPNIFDLEKRQIVCTVANEAELHTIAAKVSQNVMSGDVILLDGALAVGKTSFVRGFCKALGASENVTSPTYVIANVYDSARLKIVHIDAYRLQNAGDFYSLGVDEEMDKAVTLIEWGSVVVACFEKFLQIEIDFDPSSETARKVTFTRGAPRSFQKLFNELDRT